MEMVIDSPVDTKINKPEEPEEVYIAIYVCSCFVNRVAFITPKAELVASILGITILELECFAAAAVLMGQPQVVAIYKQRDVAESRLALIQAQMPIIEMSCHWFEIV